MAIVITVSTQKALVDGLNEVSSNLDKATGNSTEEILANDVDVQMGKFEVIKGEYGFNKTKLTVKVTNKTNDKKSLSFHIEAVDSDGSRINEGYVYANDLGAGQSQTTNNITIKSRKGLKKVPLFFCVKNVFINIKKKSNIY